MVENIFCNKLLESIKTVDNFYLQVSMIAGKKCFSIDEEIREIGNEFQKMGYTHGISKIFTDYITMVACAVSSSVDKLHYEERENLYNKTLNNYNEQEKKSFYELHTKIIDAMDKNLFQKDVLRELFHILNLSNSWNGQFFTPIHIAQFMASATLGDLSDIISTKGDVTVNEPTCGSGIMVIAAANAICHAHLSPSKNMCVMAVDNDIRCANMLDVIESKNVEIYFVKLQLDYAEFYIILR